MLEKCHIIKGVKGKNAFSTPYFTTLLNRFDK